MIPTESSVGGYRPRRRNWKPADVFRGVHRGSVTGVSQKTLDEFEPILWNDLTSEYDSHLLNRRVLDNPAKFSDEFVSFLEPWLADETNHYLGQRQIYSIFFGESVESIEARTKARVSDFSGIEPFLEDEFKLCLLLAYDEIVSTYAYHRDIPFYASLGAEPFNEWIVRIKRDEATHIQQCDAAHRAQAHGPRERNEKCAAQDRER